MTTLFKILSFWPLGVLHAMGWVMGWVAFMFSGVYRRRFLDNVQQARLLARQWLPAVGAAGKLVSELPRLWLGRSVPVQWQGAQHVDTALAHAKGVVFLTPHVGCFEVAATAYAQRYGQHGHPVTVLFRPPRQPWLAPLVIASRIRPGLNTAPTNLAGVKQLIKALKKGDCVAVLPDQVPPLGQGLWLPFFGKDAYTMTLSARLALQTGACVLLTWGERLSWGRGYVVHVQPLDAALSSDLSTATAQVNQAMEHLIMQAPQQYLWGYARYKMPRENP